MQKVMNVGVFIILLIDHYLPETRFVKRSCTCLVSIPSLDENACRETMSVSKHIFKKNQRLRNKFTCFFDLRRLIIFKKNNYLAKNCKVDLV